MAFEVISTLVTATYTVDSGDDVYIDQFGRVATDGIALDGQNGGSMTFYVEGSVVSGSNAAIALGIFGMASDTSLLRVTVGASGAVTSLDAYAMFISRTGAEIVNHGEINGNHSAVFFSVGGTRGTVTNTGNMTSRGATINAVGDAASTSGTFEITNSGVILSAYLGIRIENQSLDLVNSGTIIGDNAIHMTSNDAGTNTLDLINTGEITGRIHAITATESDDMIINSGLISGGISLEGGNDTYDGRGGTLTGVVNGGYGDDTYIIDDVSILLSEGAAQGTDTVRSFVGWKLGDNFENLTLLGDGDIRGVGNAEDNVINGNIGDNVLYGKAGNDTISGAGGADRISGQRGNDTLSGDDGNDTMRGGNGHDTMSGGDDDDNMRGGRGNDDIAGDDGNDVLLGGRGNDTLSGGSGDDILIGGVGQDNLTGGGGDDMFVFRNPAHSTDLANADHITDFTSGEDLIDLSGLAGTLDFIGGAAFSGTGAEVRVTVGSGGNSRVRIDLDGDGTTDMNIMVDGVAGLTELDFLL